MSATDGKARRRKAPDQPPAGTPDGAPALRLFQAKLRPPAVREDALARAALAATERLRGARLLLTSAPAGFGKTTVLCQYEKALRGAGVATTWLTLDAEDNDPARFSAYLRAALESVLIAAAKGSRTLDTPGDRGAVIGDTLDLIDSLASPERPLAIFLDDFEHVAANAEVRGLVARLLHTLGPKQQLVLGTRVVPDLGLARLRAGGQVIDVGLDKLRFSLDETRHFLRAAIPGLAEEDVVFLHERSEGWPAALQLSVLALRDSPRAATRLREFGGSRAEVAEYLAAEVLAGLAPDLHQFAIRTSVLDSFCAELCEEVTDMTGGAGYIERVLRANLFLVAIDAERRWFRYHALCREFLRAELERTEAALVPELSRRAAHWLEANGRQVEAVEHALRSGDQDLAARIMEECATQVLHEGQIATVLRWTNALDAGRVAGHANLSFTAALANVVAHRYAQAQRLVDAAGLRAGGKPDLKRRDLLMVRFNLVIWADQLDQLRDVLSQAAAVFSPADGWVYSSMLNCVGYLGFMEGSAEGARAGFAASKASAHHRENSVVRAYTEGLAAMVHLSRGELRDASQVSAAEFQRLAAAGSSYGTAAAIVATTLADAHFERNELAAARVLLDEHIDLVGDSCIPDLIECAFIERSRIARLEGQAGAADEFLGRLQRLGEERGLSRLVATALFEKARVALAEGRLETAAGHVREGAAYPFWERPIYRGTFGNDLENPDVALARLDLFRGGTGAVAPLEAHIAAAESAGRVRRAIKLRALRAQALWVSGQRRPALRELRRVLLEAAPEGMVRVLADEPWVLRDMLEHLAGEAAVASFGKRVADACGPLRDPAGAHDGSVESAQVLSDREIEVLARLAQGLSNKQIAAQLSRSEATIATHLRRIYGKLGAHTRTQAIAIARRGGLIA